jgi:predicted RNase H-like HicB family nuclease
VAAPFDQFDNPEGISMKRFFTLEYWLDDAWYVGRLREVPGVFSQGETLSELQENIADAYRLMLEDEPGTRSASVRTLELGVEL